ncbi:MAG: OB-fold domain-containing protein [Archaeoglobaceae archaeon]|nr:OB-fold domain-containing protein [Archaeoglobaceae archaeon]MDW8118383.1 OB-fold domain-containing protein [Archaeoglobaceae archaeon]
MASISDCSVYLPVWKIKRDEIAKATGLPSLGGEKSVAHWDEDSITMAVEAGRMLKGSFDALIFASTSSPFKIKQSASFVASALDLDNVFTMDFSNSFRASTSALITANELVDSGKFERVLVVSADCLPIKPGSIYEQFYGDAAVAIAVEKEGVAKIIGYNSQSQPLPGAWMLKDELMSYDMRLDAMFGYASSIQRSAMSLLGKLGMSPADFDRIIASAPDPKSYEGLLKAVGAKPEEFYFKSVGIAGTAHPLLLLASQLEKTGRILLGGYGEGADVIAIEINDSLQTNLGRMLESRKEISYGEYLFNKGFIATRDAPDRPPITKLWREERSVIRFYGMKCGNCGTISYPISRCCVECGTKDNYEEVKLGYRGRIYTFTIDYLVSPGNYVGDGAHPHCVAVVDLEGGGRVLFEMTDTLTDFKGIECDAEVERTFRLLFEKNNFRYYGWKARLAR